MWVQSLVWEDPLEKGMASHSSILAWKISGTEEPGGIQFMGSQRVGKDWSNLGCMHTSLRFNHQGTDSNLKGLNIKKHTPGHIRVKLLKTKDRINLLKRQRGKKKEITYKGTTFRLTSNFLKEKMNDMTAQRNSGSQKSMKWYIWCAESKELPNFYSKSRNISLKNDKS